VVLHYEVELVLIIGKKLRDLEEEDEWRAMDAIQG
jgi:2-keto-4-pentenoate hydratase/2-oxohepta-3-ene-1,7-dioic acid hydratase in catechol pathway